MSLLFNILLAELFCGLFSDLTELVHHQLMLQCSGRVG